MGRLPRITKLESWSWVINPRLSDLQAPAPSRRFSIERMPKNWHFLEQYIFCAWLAYTPQRLSIHIPIHCVILNTGFWLVHKCHPDPLGGDSQTVLCSALACWQDSLCFQGGGWGDPQALFGCSYVRDLDFGHPCHLNQRSAMIP